MSKFKTGDRVQLTALGGTIYGEVTGVVDSVNVKWDKSGNTNLWGVDMLEHAPWPVPTFKTGDIVEIQMGRFKGKLGIISSEQPFRVRAEGYSDELVYDKSELKLAA